MKIYKNFINRIIIIYRCFRSFPIKRIKFVFFWKNSCLSITTLDNRDFGKDCLKWRFVEGGELDKFNFHPFTLKSKFSPL